MSIQEQDLNKELIEIKKELEINKKLITELLDAQNPMKKLLMIYVTVLVIY